MEILLSVLLLFVLSCALLLRAIGWRQKRAEQGRQETQAQLWRQQHIDWVEGLDLSLESWLAALKLPALEEQTQRQEAARQLSTVLIERLLGKSCLRQISTVDLQPMQDYAGSVLPLDSKATSRTKGRQTRKPL